VLSRHHPACAWSTNPSCGLVADGCGALQSRLQHEGLAAPAPLALLVWPLIGGISCVDDPDVSYRLSRGVVGLEWFGWGLGCCSTLARTSRLPPPRSHPTIEDRHCHYPWPPLFCRAGEWAVGKDPDSPRRAHRAGLVSIKDGYTAPATRIELRVAGAARRRSAWSAYCGIRDDGP